MVLMDPLRSYIPWIINSSNHKMLKDSSFQFCYCLPLHADIFCFYNAFDTSSVCDYIQNLRCKPKKKSKVSIWC